MHQMMYDLLFAVFVDTLFSLNISGKPELFDPAITKTHHRCPTYPYQPLLAVQQSLFIHKFISYKWQTKACTGKDRNENCDERRNIVTIYITTRKKYLTEAKEKGEIKGDEFVFMVVE